MSECPIVLVYAEHDEDTIVDVSLELVSKARDLADELGTSVGAVVAGRDVACMVDELAHYGADTIYVIEDDGLSDYSTLPYAKALVDLAAEVKPQVFLFGATLCGRDLAPRVASALKAGLTADCTELQIGSYTDPKTSEEYSNLLYQIRPAFGGNIIATIVNTENWPQMATVREGVMKKNTPDDSRKPNVIKVSPEITEAETIVSVIERVKKKSSVNLGKAQIIVAGGAGVGSAQNFDLVFELAEAIGGEVGASRAAVDSGYIGKDHQVGQTGSTVRPKLYIACGISGQIQHRAGMQEAGKIVAVNTDPDAPIFQIAHYGIVGDLNDVIPQIIEAYRVKV
jgi:electron transfer flavoprotein alpha subunit